MTPAIERDHLAEYGAAVSSYLNVMGAAGDCLEQTFPDVGGIYRQRIHRLRARLAFDTTREAIKESAATLEAELKDYASVTNRALTQRSVELTRGILALGDIIEKLAQRQGAFASYLLRIAAQAENPDGSHAASLRGVVENMTGEAASMLAQMRDQMSDLDRRLAGTTSIDSVTDLINRREMERQMEAHKLHGSTFSLLLFEISGPMSDQVLRQAATRLARQFRHPEWIARWDNTEFAVLFLGKPQHAEARAAQVLPSLEGTYTLDNGETVLISAQARLLPEFAAC